MKNKLLSILITMVIVCVNHISYAQDLNQKYEIKIWNKDFKGIEKVHQLQTLGFLPVYQNNRDEITIGGEKIIVENQLEIQIVEDKNNTMKVELKFKNSEKNYKKEILIENKQIKDLEDFKILVEKK